MELSFDRNRTKVLIIASVEYDSFENILPIENNIKQFTNILRNENIIGISEANTNIINNIDNNKTLKSIKTFINNVDYIDFNTVIIYYTGHGYRKKNNNELYLASKNSDRDLTTSFIHFSELKETIENSHFQNRIVIIDACHSGLAALSGNNDKFSDDELTFKSNKEDNKGTYIITSSAGNELSFFDSKEKYTFFSSELFDCLENGNNEHSELIELDELYSIIQNNMGDKGLPKPQRKSTFIKPKFYFCYNTFYPFAQKKSKEDFERRKNEYRILFEAFFEKKLQRKVLLIRQKDLNLDNTIVEELETEVRNKYKEDVALSNIELHLSKIKEKEYSEKEIEELLATNVISYNDISNALSESELEELFPKYTHPDFHFYDKNETIKINNNSTEVIVIGVPGSGKTMLLSSIMHYTHHNGQFISNLNDDKSGYLYLNLLVKTIYENRLIVRTPVDVVQNIDCVIMDEDENKHPFSFIEMSGEVFNEFYMSKNAKIPDFLNEVFINENRKIIILSVDYQQAIEDNVSNQRFQLDYSLMMLEKYKIYEKVDAVLIVVTKWDLANEKEDINLTNFINQTGYLSLVKKCKHYSLFYKFKIDITTFSLGSFYGIGNKKYNYNEKPSENLVKCLLNNSSMLNEKKSKFWPFRK